MYFFYSTLYFIVILVGFSVLTACTTDGYYAPLMTNNNESFEDRQVFLPGNQPLNKKHLITTNDIKKRQSVVYQRPANSIDSASLNTFQQPSLRNKNRLLLLYRQDLKAPKKTLPPEKDPL